jgi:uncharacterized protein (TIGR02001 family)
MGSQRLASKKLWERPTSSAVLLFLVMPAFAEDKLAWSATLTGTTDYVFRGFSLTHESPAIQGSVDASYGIFYAGVWATNVEDEGYEPVEVDLYTGIKPEWGKAAFDFGALWYTYPGAIPRPLGYQYVELKVGLSFSPLSKLKMTPIFWYVPAQKDAIETFTYEGALAYELPAAGNFTPTLSGLFGYTDAEEADAFATGVDDYTYWNLGVALSVKKYTFDFRYWDTSIAGDALANEFFEFTDGTEYGLANERFVFTASVTLP